MELATLHVSRRFVVDANPKLEADPSHDRPRSTQICPLPQQRSLEPRKQRN
jgi:hypothetical protein